VKTDPYAAIEAWTILEIIHAALKNFGISQGILL
jgi:hypothetical protein